MTNSLAVAHQRIPAPLNLIQLSVGFIFDDFHECSWNYKRFNRCGGKSDRNHTYPVA